MAIQLEPLYSVQHLPLVFRIPLSSFPVNLPIALQSLMQLPRIRPPRFANPRQIWILAASFQLVVRVIFLCVWAYLGFSQVLLVKHFLLGELAPRSRGLSVLIKIFSARTLAGY